MRNCARDEGGPFGFGDQEPISSPRELLRSKAVVVSAASGPQGALQNPRSLEVPGETEFIPLPEQ
jgi:hypothetical protein